MLKLCYEKLSFTIVIEHDKDGYFASCPSLQGCFTQGDTYEEALVNIQAMDCKGSGLQGQPLQLAQIYSVKYIAGAALAKVDRVSYDGGMPSRNTEREDYDDSYYHVYNRGVNKDLIFRDETDYRVFFGLFKRYLSREKSLDGSKREYPSYRAGVELLAICLMPNHYHLLFFQYTRGTISKLMLSATTAYTMYFNKKYKRVGHLFQNRYKSSRITTDPYLLHISRYIHLNPKESEWAYTSLPYYLGRREADWIQPDKILALFDDITEYQEFLSDVDGYNESVEEISYVLADR